MKEKLLKSWIWNHDDELIIVYFRSEEEKDDFLNKQELGEFKSEWVYEL